MVELALAAESAGATIISTFSVVCVWSGEGGGRGGEGRGGKKDGAREGRRETQLCTFENIEREKS